MDDDFEFGFLELIRIGCCHEDPYRNDDECLSEPTPIQHGRHSYGLDVFIRREFPARALSNPTKDKVSLSLLHCINMVGYDAGNELAIGFHSMCYVCSVSELLA
jgi:hypothetical protein